MIVERMSGDADLDAVAALEASSFTNPWTREMLERELVQPTSARVYVLRLPDARVAAFCSCWVIVDELHINTIAVDMSRRRQGLGRALMQHILTAVAGEGVRRATLEVRRSNLAALAPLRGSGVRGGWCAETVLHEPGGRCADSVA